LDLDRTRGERDQTIGGFMRFIFRRGGTLIRNFIWPCLAMAQSV
jgi:hypothetical protein